jgi:hypothetical protein
MMNAEIQVVITELEAARLAQLQRLMALRYRDICGRNQKPGRPSDGFDSRQRDCGGS